MAVKKEWTLMGVLLFISTVFGFLGFFVGRDAFGKMIGKRN